MPGGVGGDAVDVEPAAVDPAKAGALAELAALAAVEEAGGEIATIKYCPHGPDDSCDCRKPLPGLVDQIEAELNVSAEGAWFVGDSLRDLQAGLPKGCKPALVMTGKGEKTLLKMLTTEVEAEIKQASVYTDLAHFAKKILNT